MKGLDLRNAGTMVTTKTTTTMHDTTNNNEKEHEPHEHLWEKETR
jgi:hypothetical protein